LHRSGETIAAVERGFQPQRDPHQRHFAAGDKSVSLRRKKRYTTETPRTERAGLATRFSRPHGLIFHLAGSDVVSAVHAWFRPAANE
jgi:hypothetical protein